MILINLALMNEAQSTPANLQILSKMKQVPSNYFWCPQHLGGRGLRDSLVRQGAPWQVSKWPASPERGMEPAWCGGAVPGHLLGYDRPSCHQPLLRLHGWPSRPLKSTCGFLFTTLRAAENRSVFWLHPESMP